MNYVPLSVREETGLPVRSLLNSDILLTWIKHMCWRGDWASCRIPVLLHTGMTNQRSSFCIATNYGTVISTDKLICISYFREKLLLMERKGIPGHLVGLIRTALVDTKARVMVDRGCGEKLDKEVLECRQISLNICSVSGSRLRMAVECSK